MRVTRREVEAASTPAYQELITVRKRPKARIATAMPRMVSAAAQLIVKGVPKEDFEKHHCSDTLYPDAARLWPAAAARGSWVTMMMVLPISAIESFHHRQNFFGGDAVQIACRFIGHQNGRVGDDGAGNGHALLLAAGHFTGIVIHPVVQAHHGKRHFGMLAPLSFG